MGKDPRFDCYIWMGKAEVMNFYAAAFSILMLASRCGSAPVYPDDPDAPEDCDAACGNMVRLGCEEGDGSPGPDEQFGTEDDVSCVAVCRNAMSGSKGIPVRPICVSKVDACDDVEDCYK